MCAPMRYTTRHRSVKRIFSFSSGTLNRLGSRGAVMGSGRDAAARLLDLRAGRGRHRHALHAELALHVTHAEDRKSTRLNSSHVSISYAVFCLKKKNSF